MAATITVVRRETYGSRHHVTINILFDGSYPTGGYPVSAADCGLGTLETLTPVNVGGDVIGAPDGNIVQYNPLTGKLLVLYGDNNNAADGPLIELPNGTGLSLHSANMEAVGR